MSEQALAPAPTTPLLEVEHLKLYFPVKSGVVLDRVAGWVRAVDDLSFELDEQETLGLVGESGCGKTTLARCLVQLLDPTAGAIRFRGEEVGTRGRAGRRALRRQLQIVFQDPQASLNPRKRIGQIVSAGLRLRGVKGDAAAAELRRLLGQVGLSAEYVNRFPHEFSGGQRQRVGVARALAVRPSLIVLDEPVSALDVSVQSQVINLLSDLQDEFRLGYIFVAHDLAVVRHVSDRVAVMYLGKIVELSRSDELYRRPIHPYTASLLDAIPIPDLGRRGRRAAPVRGEPPNPISPPSGCRFHPRCPRATNICRSVEPQLTSYPSGHLAACHHPLNVTAAELAAASRSPLSPLASGSELPSLVT
ncbi:MAG TPA: ABC transporter ATP-binding protein [Gaiellaceae bacterium]|nr:ABC transporter ATP-binding protein [Gaiellaceae bacterium]